MNKSPVIIPVKFRSLLRNFTQMRGDIEAWSEIMEITKHFTLNSPHGQIVINIDWKDTKEFIYKSDY